MNARRWTVLMAAALVAVAVLGGLRPAGAARARVARASVDAPGSLGILREWGRTAPASYGGLRRWGGTTIRSLDPLRAAPAWPAAQSPARAASSATTTAPTGATTTTGVTAPPPTPTPHPDVVLSNESTSTRWAYVNALGPIRARPSPSAPVITGLHWYTADGFPEIYLVLREHWDAAGQPWVLLRIPMRPNGRVGWVRRGDLSGFTLTHALVTVDRRHLRMTFSQNGRVIWSAPVGVGKPSTPTPPGHFWIRERFTITDRNSGYWPYAFGTSDYSTLSDWPGGGVVGIHGPYFENSRIPGYISHGCIRLHPSDDAWLARHMGLGTPVHII